MRTFPVLLLASLLGFALPLRAEEARVFYVAPEGLGIEQARNQVRELRKSGFQGAVRVLLKTGTYPPLTFGPEDSAPAGSITSYEAAPGATPIISGGSPLSFGLKDDGLWEAPVITVFRDLYREGRRLTPAREPEVGEFFRVSEVSEDVKHITLDPGVGAPDIAWNPGAELVVLQNWSISRAPLDAIEKSLLTSRVPVGWIGHGDATTTSPGKPAFVERILQGLDTPGEWCIDEAAKVVRYLLAENELPGFGSFVAPLHGQLLGIQGTPEAPVRGLRFKGIRFEYSAWELPEAGYMGIQAGHYGTTMAQAPHVLPNAVLLVHAEGCAFIECDFRRLGASGIGLGRGCRENVIGRSTFDDIGGNGIVIGWRGTGEMSGLTGDISLAADWPDPALAPRGNEVSDCIITRCGAVNGGCVGIFDAFSKGSHIHHNEISDMPYTGMSVGYFWGTKPTSQEGARIEYNHIHNVMQQLADGGGIYTLGLQPGTVLRGNHIHQVHRSGHAQGGAPNNGIFFDEGSSGFHVEGNLIYDTSGEAIRFNQTSEAALTWKDNAFGAAPGGADFPMDRVAAAGPRGMLPPRDTPKLGVVLNEDNSHFFGSRAPEDMSMEGLHAFVDQYAGTKVSHLFLNASAMRASYDSAVWDDIWEVGNQRVPEDCEVCRKWVDNARLLHERGLDPYAVWIARSREKGISPWISMRMNDVHDVSDTTNFMHSTFWLQHPEYWRVPGSNGSWVDRAFNYLIPEVREHHMALVRELLDRYDMDGLELDWMRFGWHFPPGKEAEGAEVLTQFMRDVRALTQAAAERRGHPVQLSARVPTHPDAAIGLGMDGIRWAQEGLIDWLVPTPFWATADFDIPVELWRERLGSANDNILLTAGMEILTRAHPGGKAIEADLENVYGFASSALQRGADGVYFFNYMDPGPMQGGIPAYRRLLEQGINPPSFETLPRRYLVTYRDTVPPGMSSGAVLPAATKEGLSFDLQVGDSRGSAATLRIGLAAAGQLDSVVLEAAANSVVCEALPDLEDRGAFPDAARLLQFRCPLEALKAGVNHFEIKQREGAAAQIIWAELHLAPNAPE